MGRYEINVCDDAGCKIVKTMRKEAAAKREAHRQFKKKAKAMLKSKRPAGSISVDVRLKGRGLPEDGQRVHHASLRFGEPGYRRPSKRITRRASSASPASDVVVEE